MSQNKRVPMFLGISFVALLAILAWPSREKAQRVFEGASPLEATTLPPGTPSEDIGSTVLELQRERSAQLAWGRDPFRDPTGIDAKSPTLRVEVSSSEGTPGPERPRLTGFCTVGRTCMAIVGREVVRLGDKLRSGYTVTSFGVGSVTLTRGDEILVLGLGDDR